MTRKVFTRLKTRTAKAVCSSWLPLLFAVMGLAVLLPTPVQAQEPICDPRTQGYWHRQCLGVPASEGGLDPGRNGRGPQSPTEPNFVDELMACADNDLEELGFFGVTTCEGMDADPPSDDCERALKQLTALILNVCSDRLQLDCPVCLEAVGTFPPNVELLISDVASYIHQGGMCKAAAEMATLANEGEAICVLDD